MIQQLKSLNPDGTAPETRIARAGDAYEIWNQLRMSDAASSFERARWQAMYDNERPLNQAQLDSNGQSYRVNVAWGIGAMLLQMAQSGYVNMINATETFFDCPTEADMPPEQRSEAEQKIAGLVTETIRSWEDFMPNFLRVTSTFIKEAVSFATMDDESDWRFDAKGLSDFKIPRKTKVGQENIEVSAWLRFYSASQLYQAIKDPEVAEANGWDVKAVKKVILNSVNNANTFNNHMPWEWEKLETELKNNDFFWTYGVAQTQSIRIVHMLWREFSGRYSFGIFCDDKSQDSWLCKKIDRFESSYNAFVVFTYGVGNDYYHGIRGQGYTIYPIVGALNRAYCQLLEVATYGTVPTIHVKDESAMAAFQFTPSGAFNLTAGDYVFESGGMVQNISSGVLPMIQTFDKMLRDQTANANTESLTGGSKEMTAAEFNGQLASIAKMSNTSESLFHDPWELLLREMVRRMKRRDWSEAEAGGRYIMQLHKKILKEGGPKLLEAFYQLDTTRLKATRAMGGGSEAATQLAYNQLMPILAYLPESGQRNVIRGFVASRVGYRNVDAFTSPNSSPALNAQESIAWLQNSSLLTGGFEPVLPNDDHFVHARVAAEALAPMAQNANDMLSQVDANPDSIGEIAKLLEGLGALNAHLTEHVQKISVSPEGEKLVGQYKQVLQQVDELQHNGILHIQKLQERMAKESQSQGEEPQPQVDPQKLSDIEAKRAVTEAQIESIRAKTQANIEATQAKTEQQLALADASMSQKLLSNAAIERQKVRQNK